MRNGEINTGSPISLSNQEQLQRGEGEGAESSAQIFGSGTASGTFTFIYFDCSAAHNGLTEFVFWTVRMGKIWKEE